MDLKESDILGSEIDRHWYYRSKADALKKYTADCGSPVILDVGAGSGFFSKKMLAETEATEAWCIDPNYTEEMDVFPNGKTIHFRKNILNSDASLVLLMDVLEHVDDDVGLLTDYVTKVPSGAYFFITVPAFNFLWSGHDEFLGHKRRYTLSHIEDVARKSGLLIEKSSYFFGAVFPIAFVARMVTKAFNSRHAEPKSQLVVHSPIINETLALMTRAELPLIFGNRLFGLSAFCFARKK